MFGGWSVGGGYVLPRGVTYWKLTTLNFHINSAPSNLVMDLNENLIQDQSEIYKKTYVARFKRTENVKITSRKSKEMALGHVTKETSRT